MYWAGPDEREMKRDGGCNRIILPMLLITPGANLHMHTSFRTSLESQLNARSAVPCNTLLLHTGEFDMPIVALTQEQLVRQREPERC